MVSEVCWGTLGLASVLFGVGSSGASDGRRLSSDCSAGPGRSLGVSCGAANTSCCKGSDWLLGRLLHPSEDAWELLCGEANSSPLQIQYQESEIKQYGLSSGTTITPNLTSLLFILTCRQHSSLNYLLRETSG